MTCSSGGGRALTEGRVIAFDHGQRRIGVAIGDRRSGIASPLRAIVVERVEDAVGRAAARAREEDAAQIVVGLPLHMDDAESDQSKQARAFGDALGAATGLPVEYHDERLTSFEADELMAGSGLTKKQRKARRDSIAAQRILAGWLAANRSPDAPPTGGPSG